MENEKLISDQIEELELEIKAARLREKDLKSQLTKCQDKIIESSIKRDRLREELRQQKLRDTKVKIISIEESDLNRFRELLPELLKKI